MARETIHRVRGAALRALTSAPRLELLEALMACQPATAEELGRFLGRDPKSLYHHLRPLLAAGLVTEVGKRPTERRPAALYGLPADRLELDPEDDSAEAREARRQVARSVLRAALAHHEAALDDPATRLGGRFAELTLGSRVLRLTPRGLERARRAIRELAAALGEEVDAERGEPFAFTVHLAPVRGRRTGSERP